MDQPTVWRPLAGAELAGQIWQVLREIGEALAAVDPTDPAVSPVPTNTLPAELALFFSYLAQARNDDEELADVALGFLEQAMAVLESGSLPPHLYGGYVGIAWILQHLDGRLFEFEEDDLAGVDRALVQLLEHSAKPRLYDLIGGLVGFAVYLLDRLPRPRARQGLETIVSYLVEAAEHDDDGVKWHTPPELLPPHQREQLPLGCYNLGVAHGIPGVVGVLALIHAAGVCREETGELLDRAVPWVLAQERKDAAGTCFPVWVGEQLESHASRLAWCYGDVGVAMTLLSAGLHRERPDWQREGMRLIRRSAALSREAARVDDAGLCHGTAGLFHLFNRVYQATGDETVGEAARTWLRETLAIRLPDKEIAGFPSWNSSLDEPWVVDASLLTGTAGVGLSLVSAVAPIEPAWDFKLLAALPVRGQDG
jgi:class I lanthipeptide synthase